MVKLGQPILGDIAARVRLQDLLLEAEREAAKDGRKRLKKEEREGIACSFFASEDFLGPITAESIAGWMGRNLKILPKEGGSIPFVLNDIQWSFLLIIVEDWNAGRLCRYIVLKARQFGISTFLQGLIWFLLCRFAGKNAATVAHKDDATANLFEMIRRFFVNMPQKPKLSRFSLKGLEFAHPHDTRMTLETAESKEAKRSFTIHYAHLSEPAFWPQAEITDLGLMQAIPDEPGTLIVKESTANGVGGLFYGQYWDAKAGKGKYRALFFPWFLNSKYALEIPESEQQRLLATRDEEEQQLLKSFHLSAGQLAWRRYCIVDKCAGDVGKFHQEYPSTDREAFLVSGRPVFDLALLDVRAREAQEAIVVFQGTLGYDLPADKTTGESPDS